MDEGKEEGPKSGGGVTWRHRNLYRSAAVEADPDEEIRRPGGLFQRGRRGEIAREAGAICRRRRASNLARSKWN
jgi:hypothetical protein